MLLESKIPLPPVQTNRLHNCDTYMFLLPRVNPTSFLLRSYYVLQGSKGMQTT